ncbi:GNAT family N-acetyltransferase [Devosia nitrariae]|uniref:N-acetyltransferase GCN5 n=1 Tax=Devosia nitrariae TaxID=2071872 RepID=A0ABQ5W3P0_9HYPH|nr:GNAT family N-acetyltransferase [Devosia nitrariae]GLQ54673.1 N-acetyltransferase GCN5 [Devosia nitrariae]
MIRVASLSDMPVCAAIFNRWVDETEWMPRVHDHDDVVRHYRETVYSQCQVFVAERHGAVGAFLALSDQNFVTALYADGRSRGLGLGTLLIDRAKQIRPDGLSLWTFVANEDAQRFYRRQGFVEERRTTGENEEGLPDILLRWSGKVPA